MSDEDVKLAEDIIQVLKPLKMVTNSAELRTDANRFNDNATETHILESMKVRDTDTTVVKDVKSAIVSDLINRYPESDSILVQFLHMSTALDPRFKSLPFLDETMRSNLFNSLMEKILEYHPQQVFFIIIVLIQN